MDAHSADSGPPWRLSASAWDDSELLDKILETYQQVYSVLPREMATNDALPIEIRSLRRVGDWRVLLLLTPWQLARLLFPMRPPSIAQRADWPRIFENLGASPTALGPAFGLDILSGRERAHLAFEPRLGHYFQQILVHDMRRFRTPDAAFVALRAVIAVRDRNIAALQKQCPWQEDVSRREFFSRLVRRASPQSR